MPNTAVIISYRLGCNDGVSIEAAKWKWALEQLGWNVLTVAGQGVADRIINGLSHTDSQSLDENELRVALSCADLVVVENVLSLPLNRSVALTLAKMLRGRAALLHHHDLAWQRPTTLHHGPPAHDPGWLHITINEFSRRQLQAVGIEATTIYNSFASHSWSSDSAGAAANRELVRSSLHLSDFDLLVLQPTRAIPRKCIPHALSLCRSIQATYWLTGQAEDGYGPTLKSLLTRPGIKVIRGLNEFSLDEAYAACDLVALPSSWEGFGNPALEASAQRKPVVVGDYPVARELTRFGFRWLSPFQRDEIRETIQDPEHVSLAINQQLVETHFSQALLPHKIALALHKIGF